MWKLSSKKCRTLFSLSPAEKILLLQSCFQLRHIRIALARKPFKTVLEDVKRRAVSGPVSREANPAPRKICGWIERCASNLPGTYTCLPKALAGFLLCGRYGHRTKLCFGAARSEEAGFHAHAWLEYDGEVVLGDLPDLENFHPFEQDDELFP